MHVHFRSFRPGDLPGLLRVQRDNLIGNVTVEERSQGFLSVEFLPTELEEIHREIPIIVAEVEDTLGGYVFGTTLERSRSVPILAHMISLFNEVRFHQTPLNQYRSFMYGPICVARPFRGTGILEGLVAELCRQIGGRFEIGISFVALTNPRSFEAHVRKLQMEEIARFEFEGKPFHMLAFDIPVIGDDKHSPSLQH